MIQNKRRAYYPKQRPNSKQMTDVNTCDVCWNATSKQICREEKIIAQGKITKYNTRWRVNRTKFKKT